MLPWEPSEVRLVLWLEDVRSGRRIPGSERRLPLPSPVLKGEEVTIPWAVPADWPLGRCHLRMDLVLRDSVTFSALGDVAPKVAVVIR